MDILTVKRTKAGQIKRIVEYVNVETGEIIPGSTVPVLSLGVKLEQRSRILGKLRPEVRQFAAFVLRFANKRRGITPGAEELCNWYAGLHGKRPGNVRRYIKTLMDAKVLHSTHLLGRLFQRTGGTALDHLSEDEQAAALYQGLRQRNFDPINSVEKRTGPALLVASEVASLDTVMEAERSEWYARTLPEMSGSLSSTVRKPAPVLDCCLFPEYLRREAMALL